MKTVTPPAEGTTQALNALGEAATEFRQVDADHREKKTRRDRALVAAQAAGATYPQMAAAAKISRDRVAQVLARERQR